MRLSYGGLKIAANTTAHLVPATAAKYTTGWAAHGVGQHGDTGVTASATNSKLTLTQGVWKVDIQLVVETDVVSGTSGDSVGVITFTLYKGGAAVTNAVAKIDAQASDRPQTIFITDIVEVTAAQVAASTNYVELYCAATDASGNDIIVRNGVFLATRLA